MDDAPSLADEEAAFEAALARIPRESSEALKAAIVKERARHASLVTQVDERAYREAVEGIVALGGSDPDAWAAPRRRFW